MLMDANIELVHCTLAGNAADDTGGAMVLGSDGWSFLNCIVAYNQDETGMGRSIAWSYSSGRGSRAVRGISYEDIAEKGTISYCCLQLDPGETEAFVDTDDIITADPMFVKIPNGGSDGWGDDPETFSIDEGLNDDYGDLRLGVGSPCINTGYPLANTGDTAYDLDGQPRTLATTPDMGAYEFNQPTIEVTRPQGNEIWAAGSTQQVSWSSVSVESTVDILFRSAPGQAWQKR